MLCIALAATAAMTTHAHVVAAGQSRSTAPSTQHPLPTTQSAAARVLYGTLAKVDTGAKTIAIKTVDGGERLVRFTDNTVVHGIPRAAKADALAGKEGAHVVVHYTEAAGKTAERAGRQAAEATGRGVRDAGEKTAEAVVFVGNATVKVAEGTVTTVDRAAKTIAIDTAKGTRELFRLGEDCTINTAHGVERAATASGRALEKGARAVVYYTEEGGQKVIHAIDTVAHAR